MAPSFGFVANSKMLSPSNNEGEIRQEAAVSPGEAGDTAIKPIPLAKGDVQKRGSSPRSISEFRLSTC
jgi:hypothetical protein